MAGTQSVYGEGAVELGEAVMGGPTEVSGSQMISKL